jgi:hypothetical protein
VAQEHLPTPLPQSSLAFRHCCKKEVSTGEHSSKEGNDEYGNRLVLAGVGYLETLIEVDIRYIFSILGLDCVLELWFQIVNWQFTENRVKGGYKHVTQNKWQIALRKHPTQISPPRSPS